MKKLLRIILFAGLFWSLPATAWAIPQLQLYFDPTLNPGAFYNPVHEGWETSQNPLTLTTFMHGLSPEDIFRVIVSLPGRLESSDPTWGIGMTVTDIDGSGGGVLSGPGPWVFGTPELPGHGHDELPPHGVFKTWVTSFDFKFASPENQFPVFDVQNPGGTTAGFRDDFLISFSGPESNAAIHFDLIDVDAGKFAPFSHDASANITNIIPEAPVNALLLMGAITFLGVGYRRWRARSRVSRKAA